MSAELSPLEPEQLDAIVELSARAWEPVFSSLRETLGLRVFNLLHPDWRADQAQAVARVCLDSEVAVWVASLEGVPAGFVALRGDPVRRLGTIEMLAVDPQHQRRGIATQLTEHALERLRDGGMLLATVETGGDAGHAPARAVYERAGFTALPIERYFCRL